MRVSNQTFHVVIDDEVRLTGYLQDWARSHGVTRLPEFDAPPADREDKPEGDEDHWDTSDAYRTQVVRPRNQCIDAIVFGGDLSPAESAAIQYTYRVRMVYGFPRNNLPYLLEQGRAKIMRILKKRGLWLA